MIAFVRAALAHEQRGRGLLPPSREAWVPAARSAAAAARPRAARSRRRSGARRWRAARELPRSPRRRTTPIRLNAARSREANLARLVDLHAATAEWGPGRATPRPPHEAPRYTQTPGNP